MKPILKKQPSPNHIKVEFTEGCNLFCKFCPIHAIRKGPGNLEFMQIRTVKKIISEIKRLKWKNKFEFTGHGEPLLNKNYLTYYKMFREAFPKAYMFTTTNGGKLLSGKGPTYNIDNILKYVNVIAMDDYEHSGFIPKILKAYNGKHPIFVYPDMPTYTSQYINHRYVVIYPDISKQKIKERVLSNTAGNCGNPDFKYKDKTCHRPFREMNITYNGTVILCCYDWQMKYKIANIHQLKLDNIWNHRRFRAARRILHHDGRHFRPCYGCDNRLYRIGLLPDRMGKYTLLKPTKNDLRIIWEVTYE